MRICYLGDAANVHILKRATFMTAKGHEVHIVSLGNRKLPVSQRVPVHVVQPYPFAGKLNYILQVRRFVRLIHGLQPDLLDVQFLTSGGFIGRFVQQIPIVATAWGSDVLISGKNSWFFAKILRDICRKAVQVISVSPQITRELIALGVEPGKIATFPLGVELGQYIHNPAVKTTNTPLILSTRWHEPVYNLELLIEAVPLVLKAVPNAQFILAGDGSRRAALEQRVRNQGADKNVSFLGRVEHRQMARLYTQAHIYVSTAKSDGASESLFEALAGGAFPIVTDIPANTSWIEDGVSGWLVPTDQPAILAKRIVQTINSPQLQSQAAEYNYQLVSNKANLHKNLERLEAIYLKLLKN